MLKLKQQLTTLRAAPNQNWWGTLYKEPVALSLFSLSPESGFHFTEKRMQTQPLAGVLVFPLRNLIFVSVLPMKSYFLYLLNVAKSNSIWEGRHCLTGAVSTYCFENVWATVTGSHYCLPKKEQLFQRSERFQLAWALFKSWPVALRCPCSRISYGS